MTQRYVSKREIFFPYEPSARFQVGTATASEKDRPAVSGLLSKLISKAGAANTEFEADDASSDEHLRRLEEHMSNEILITAITCRVNESLRSVDTGQNVQRRRLPWALVRAEQAGTLLISKERADKGKSITTASLAATSSLPIDPKN